ncbi:hypothetical protein LY76DRAFT_609467 [Colletotrichum caudatum]|nr:hypothetical protein LY76DRAFT_609467 [Colletotrichum caudatum]
MHLNLVLFYWLAVVGLAQADQPGKSIIQSRGSKTTPLFDAVYWAVERSSSPDTDLVADGWYMLSYHREGMSLQSGKYVEDWGLIVGRVKKTRRGFLYADSTYDFEARLYSAGLVEKKTAARGARWVWGSTAWKKAPRRGDGTRVTFLGATKARRATKERLQKASDTWVQMAAARVPRLKEPHPIEGLYTTGHGYVQFLEKILSTDATMTTPPAATRPPPPVPQPTQSKPPKKKVSWGPKDQYYPVPPRPTGRDDDDSSGGPDGSDDSDDSDDD